MIATDESQSEGKEKVDDQNGSERKKSKKHRKHKLDAEFGVVRGIDFKNVHTVSLFCSLWNVVLHLAAYVFFFYHFLLSHLVIEDTQPSLNRSSGFCIDLILHILFMSYFAQVINYEMPQTAAGYVHRIGRTGRAYNTGASVSLVSSLKTCLRSLIYNCDC